MAAIVETHHDDKGIMWPDNVAPYNVYLARIGEAEAVVAAAEELYKSLTQAGVLVLYDDRNEIRAGEKFADADLLGIPYRVVVSDRTLAAGQYEVKKRGETDAHLLEKDKVIKMVAGTK